MKRLLAALLLILLAAQALLPQPAEKPALFSQIDGILGELRQITGLKPRRPVRYDMIGRDGLKRFLEERIREVVKPEELRAEELTLKKFGLLPADFDLRSATVELLTEQAAAFYDFKRKKLFILESNPSFLQQTALVHELAHALADQHFHLENFIADGQKSDDGALARAAVMEGQASWITTEYLARRNGRSLKDGPELLESALQAARGAASGEFPVLEKTPLYLRETLMFPYTEGMVFQHRLVEKLGQAAFAQPFRRPPASTQQILHPELYHGGAAPANPPLPEPARRREFRTLMEGTLGELDHSILLRQYCGEEEARAVAPLWRGGAYRLLEHKRDKHTVLVHASVWESASAAQRYFRLYAQVLRAKWKSLETLGEDGGQISGRGDDGYFLLRVEDTHVSSMEGLSSPGEASLRRAKVN